VNPADIGERGPFAHLFPEVRPNEYFGGVDVGKIADPPEATADIAEQAEFRWKWKRTFTRVLDSMAPLEGNDELRATMAQTGANPEASATVLGLIAERVVGSSPRYRQTTATVRSWASGGASLPFTEGD